MRREVSFIPCATSSKEQTGNIITFAHFEEKSLLSEAQNLLYETWGNTESGNKYDDNYTMTPLISEE